MPTAGCGPDEHLAVEADRAGARPVEAGDEAQQRGLAAARAADQRDDLAFLHGEIDVGERARAVGIGLGEVFEGQHRTEPLPHGVLPAHERLGAGDEQAVGGLAEQREGDDGGEDLVGLAHLLAVDEQIAEALRCAHEFGRDHEHEAEAEARAQGDHGLRQHRRQQDAPGELDARETEHAADFDELAVDGEDRARDAEIDRKEHADGDERHLRGLEDAEPQDEQRHPGDGGNGAQGLQRRIEQAPHGLGWSRRARRARCRRRPR